MEKIKFFVKLDKNLVKFLCLPIIKLYKITSQFFPKRCRFYPTCSEYSLQAFQKKGFLKGLFLTVNRLRKCHPFCEGGIDYLED